MPAVWLSMMEEREVAYLSQWRACVLAEEWADGELHMQLELEEERRQWWAWEEEEERREREQEERTSRSTAVGVADGAGDLPAGIPVGGAAGLLRPHPLRL